MHLEALITAFSDISTSHKAVERFYHGLENEDNTDYEGKYPAVLMLPTNINYSYNNGVMVVRFNCSFMITDILPEDRSTADIKEGCVKTQGIWQDILSRFIVEYLGSEKTINSNTVAFNFEVGDVSSNIFVDKSTYNKIGYEVQLPLTIAVNPNYCLVQELFV